MEQTARAYEHNALVRNLISQHAPDADWREVTVEGGAREAGPDSCTH